MMTTDEKNLQTWFTHHPPKPDQIIRYEEIRAAAHTFATVIYNRVPAGLDRTVVFRKIREAVMTANAAIACGEA